MNRRRAAGTMAVFFGLLIVLFLVTTVALSVVNWGEPRSYLAFPQQASSLLLASNNSDGDMLSDADETWLADKHSPVLVFDEEEGDCVSDLNKVAIIYQVHPFAVYSNLPDGSIGIKLHGALITYVFLHPKDCGGWSTGIGASHNGDTEAIRIYVAKTGANTWKATRVLMTRHGDPWESRHIDDFVWLEDPVTGRRTHPKIYVSESKHAMYNSLGSCHSYGPWFFNYEDCGGGAQRSYQIIFEQNVGERGKDNRIFDKLSDSGSRQLSTLYSNEYAWTDRDFCGNRSRGDCAGAITGKWWPPLKEKDRKKQAELIFKTGKKVEK